MTQPATAEAVELILVVELVDMLTKQLLALVRAVLELL
jgi:hypothetical protein